MTIPATLDHLVYGVPDLDAAVSKIEARLGVSSRPGTRQENAGTHNAFLALGPRTYLEVLAPDPYRQRRAPLPYGLDQLSKPKLLAWAVRSHQLGADAARLRESGFDPGQVRSIERVQASGDRVEWHLVLPAPDPPNQSCRVVPLLIDRGESPDPALGDSLCSISTLCLGHPNPASVVQALGALGLPLPVARASAPWIEATLVSPRGRYELR